MSMCRPPHFRYCHPASAGGNVTFVASWLGRIAYREAWEIQQRVAQEVAEGKSPGCLLLLEHPPVITMGARTNPEHLLVSELDLASRGVDLVQADRGGDVTYHGPGQLVGYPIFPLRGSGLDVHDYLRRLELYLIALLQGFGVEAETFPPHTGVWTNGNKIAAIGIKVSRGITQHGFALNGDPDLAAFRMIVPCGIRTYGVTSIANETGRAPGMLELAREAAGEFAGWFPEFVLRIENRPSA